MLLAGLGAALIIGGLAAVRPEATPFSNETPWVERDAQNVTPGQAYRLDACLTVTAPGLTFVFLRVVWHEETVPFVGPSIFEDNLEANAWPTGQEQCLSLTAGDFLDVLLNPGRLVEGRRSLSAYGREAADDEGCPKPGQEQGSPWQGTVRGRNRAVTFILCRA